MASSMTDTETSAGVFTTQKLQALLDCRRNPDVPSRAALAEAVTAISGADESITVHGIDAWFKRYDSNYGIEKQSLERGRRTYPIPGGRWAALLEVFDLSMDDLAPRDPDFRRWCFEARRAQVAKPKPKAPEHQRPLLVVHTAADARALASTLRTLEAADYALIRPEADTADPEAEIVRQLNAVQAAIVFTPLDGSEDPLLFGTLEHARRLGVPALCVCHDGPCLERAIDAGFDVLLPDPEGGDDEIAARLSTLTQRAPSRARPPAPSWTRPEPVTDRPSIAVLPFVNLGGEDGNGLLADGLTEDITTLLSRIPEFFVIANSTMQVYRDDAPDVATLREHLGVRYLMKGSVRGAGGKVRVSVELVDAKTGASVFARRFDRALDDLFEVQDDVTLAVCAQLEPKLRLDDMAYGARAASLPAWRLWQEGWHWLFVDAPEPVPKRALDRFEQAIALESDYALGHAGKAIALSTGMLWGGLGPERMVEAKDHAETAYKLLPENPVALYAMALITFVEPVSLTVPLEFVERAVELEPSNPMYHGVAGYLVANLGDAQRGVDQCLHAMRLSPKDSREPFLCYMLGASYIANEQYELAIETMTRCRRFSEVDFIWLMIAYAHAQLGEVDRAIASLKRIETPRPYRFYRFAVQESLWLKLPPLDKQNFLRLFEHAGIT